MTRSSQHPKCGREGTCASPLLAGLLLLAPSVSVVSENSFQFPGSENKLPQQEGMCVHASLLAEDLVYVVVFFL